MFLIIRSRAVSTFIDLIFIFLILMNFSSFDFWRSRYRQASRQLFDRHFVDEFFKQKYISKPKPADWTIRVTG